MNRKGGRKLHLNRETLRNLRPNELEHAAGGGTLVGCNIKTALQFCTLSEDTKCIDGCQIGTVPISNKC